MQLILYLFQIGLTILNHIEGVRLNIISVAGDLLWKAVFKCFKMYGLNHTNSLSWNVSYILQVLKAAGGMQKFFMCGSAEVRDVLRMQPPRGSTRLIQLMK